MRWLCLGLVLLLSRGGVNAAIPSVQTVFVVLMENHNWSEIKGSSYAPYINNTLLPQASYCAQYYNPPGLHPSEPNYLWLEAGTNFGIFDDLDPSANHQSSTNHLASQLSQAAISWRAYQEDIDGLTVPLTSVNGYTPRHNPFVYFDDVTGTNNPGCAYGIEHIRPYRELAGDLTNGTVARYNFITPNLCHDMHDACGPLVNSIAQGDAWLASELPKLLDSAAYQNAGALFIVWDESENGDGPIGLIALSPLAKGGGYCSTNRYTHSSLLRTLQEIFGVRPWLGDAARAYDLEDLFALPTANTAANVQNGYFQFTVTGVTPGSTNVVETTTDFLHWTPVSTNVATADSLTFVENCAANASQRFFRVVRQQ